MSQKKQTKRDLLSIDHEDDQKNYEEFDKFITDHTERRKRRTADEIFEMGETFLAEIDHKKILQEEEKQELIPYILSKTNKYSTQYLHELSFEDVQDIHAEIKYQNRSFFRKLIEFFS